MRIVSMTATFGGLDRATLTLSDGLNLLELPNERGKSTWCAFIRAMFYGLESRKGRDLSERNRYTPWSGAPMSGTMDLIWNGKAVTLRRFGKGSNPFGGFQAVYTGTEEPVPGLTADNVGETILGVTKEAFQRTCFIPQGGLWVDASGDLERRIAALASSGEEDVSYSDAEGRLRDWRNARQSNRSNGSLPKLRAQLVETQAQRQRLLDARARGAQAQTDLERLEQQKTDLETDLARHAALAEAAKLEGQRKRYEAAAQRLSHAEEALMAARAVEARAKERVPAPPRSGAGCWLPLIFGLILTAGLAAAALALRQLWLLLPALAPTLVGGGASWWLHRRRKAAGRAYDEGVKHWANAQAATQTAQDEHIAARSAWEAVSAQGEPPAAPKPSDMPKYDLARAQTDLARVRQELVRCQDQRARAQGEEAALGGLEPLEEQLATLEQAIAKEEQELAALNLALEVLQAANAQLQTRFSPALNAKAGALLSKLTGGRYTALTFTREFQALARGDGEARAAQLLSQGTADQVYLALRLAICLLALPGEDPAPLILDDALVSFDDERLKRCLDVLQDLAKTRQVLLFTCQGRERQALANS